jgi:hypothetical protein
MKHFNDSRTNARRLLFLLVISVSLFIISCEQKAKQNSNKIEQDELNQALQDSKENTDLIKRLDERFAGYGFTFSLMYPTFDESDISEFTKVQPMLVLDNVAGKVSIAAMKEKVRKFLGEEEWGKFRIGHMTKPGE